MLQHNDGRYQNIAHFLVKNLYFIHIVQREEFAVHCCQNAVRGFVDDLIIVRGDVAVQLPAKSINMNNIFRQVEQFCAEFERSAVGHNAPRAG